MVMPLLVSVGRVLGDPRLEVQHHLGLFLRVLAAHKLEELGCNLHQLLSVPLHLIRVLSVVRLVGEGVRAGTNVERLGAGVSGVGRDVPREQHVDVLLVQLRHDMNQGRHVLDGVDQVQPWRQRLRSQGVNTILIHARAEVEAGRPGVRLEQLRLRLPDHLVGIIPAEALGGLELRDILVRGIVVAACKLIEVVAGINIRVDRVPHVLREARDLETSGYALRSLGDLLASYLILHEPDVLEALDEVDASISIHHGLLEPSLQRILVFLRPFLGGIDVRIIFPELLAFLQQH
mmetsp:Transcript_46551/g.145958  ORF Transcript_46551/g.145958 Transcript_46551/m.145958 type:complete len:291 (-) Transcript_46551:135-1007(-)